MRRNRGVNAAAWFYAQPGFHSYIGGPDWNAGARYAKVREDAMAKMCADCETEGRTGTGVHGTNEDCHCPCHKRGDGVAVPLPGYYTAGLSAWRWKCPACGEGTEAGHIDCGPALPRLKEQRESSEREWSLRYGYLNGLAEGTRTAFREAARIASVRAAKQRAEAERHYQPEPGGGCDADMYDADAMACDALAKVFYAKAEEARSDPKWPADCTFCGGNRMHFSGCPDARASLATEPARTEKPDARCPEMLGRAPDSDGLSDVFDRCRLTVGHGGAHES